MEPVIQRERTGCGIAAAAAIAGISYARAKSVANALGIFAHDRHLWSETRYVRRLLKPFGYATAPQRAFRSWRALPDLALLATKWRKERGRPFWHWVVFVRAGGRAYVLDSKKSLRHHMRTDFGRMKPKWFIPVSRRKPTAR